MAYDPSIFNINPYYDDYNSDAGFLRVLFKPGYAVQARELTQAQSILQNQISKLGDHLFKDGSRIVGGGITVRNGSYLMIDVGSTTSLSGITDYSVLVGGVLTSIVSTNDSTKAKIVHYIDPDVNTDGKLILVVDFVSGGNSFIGSCTFTKDDVVLPLTISAYDATLLPSPAGDCKIINVGEGIFYIDGFFVRTPMQTFTPFTSGAQYRDLSFGVGFASLTKKIGFSITRDSVTEQEDATLRDPAIGSYNYNAPGADRYKIILSLAQAAIDETPDDFVELLIFENGRLTKKVDKITYGELQNVLAMRTYDESGSYTVKPFDLVLKPSATDPSGSYSVSVGTGKAYVLGYDVENQYPVNVDLLKARTTQTESSLAFPFSVGTYIGVCMGNTASGYGLTFSTNLVTIGAGSAAVSFYNSSNALVASGKVHGVVPTPQTSTTNGLIGNYFRLYLYGVNGSIVQSNKGYIYDHSTGNTLGSFVTQGTSLFNAPTATNDASLVYELSPGYAVNEISSLTVYGKLVSDLGPIATHDATVIPPKTTYALTKSNFTGTIATGNASVFNFINYGSSSYPNNSDILEISFVNSNSVGYAPTTSLSLQTNTSTNTVSAVVESAPSGFTSGNIRAVMPVVYTPSITDISTYRYKTATVANATISSVSSVLTDENGRKYYLMPFPDVYSISSVVNNTTPTIDYTDDFELDDGQRESFYDYSRLYLKESVATQARYTTSVSSVTLLVSYSYFVHGGLAAGPFIGKHSYIHVNNPTFSYENIPLYTNTRTGKTVSLANCLDFRHSGPTTTTPMLKPYGRSEFGVAQDTVVSYNHYLPRIDKLCVKQNQVDGSASFSFVQGTPSMSPSAPPDPQDSLVLASFTVPAYTHNAQDIAITPFNSKRYTMSDIGKIQKQVDEVSMFTKLSLSESEIESRSLKLTSSSVEPLKTSIFSDEFYGHSISDVNDSMNSCSIDYERGELRPFFTTNNISNVTPSYTGVTLSTDGLLTLNYSGITYINNTKYTKTIKINPSNTINWLGFMKLSQSTNAYFDTGYRPVVKTNAFSENDNWLSGNANNDRGFGTQWNDWESIWTGIEQVEEEQDDLQKRIVEIPHLTSDSAVPSFNSGSIRVGVSRKVETINQKNSNYIRVQNLKNRIKHTINSRVVDRSVVPYIPAKTAITATVNGLKPNTNGLSLYFDGELLISNISTDANGSCVVSFNIPPATFLIGERIVRVSDSSITANATMSAEAVYSCNGLIEQRVDGSYSTRPPELRRQTTTSEAISKDPFNRNVDSLQNIAWSDPLSQTFFVDAKTNPSGIFLNNVSLYFSAKDSVLPVTIQIRPTVSGYPSPSVVIPFSTVVKLPSAITASSSPTATNFLFSSPVYLEPGEYSICILTNSNNYELFASESSINANSNADAISGRAGNNQLVGTLFTPRIADTSVPDNLTDIMFSVRRCEFVATGTLSHTTSTNATSCQILKFYAPEIVPSGSSLTRKIGATSFLNNESIYLSSVLSSAPSLVYDMSRGANTAISPAIELSSLYSVGVSMYATPTTPISRYVSRVVELTDDIASTGISVFADINTPTNSSIDVYYRSSLVGESDIFSKDWKPLTRTNPTFVSSSELDFREGIFRSTTTESFKTYQVMIVMQSSAINSSYYKTPAIRNIRTVSFITP